jgi:hypothetical protein
MARKDLALEETRLEELLMQTKLHAVTTEEQEQKQTTSPLANLPVESGDSEYRATIRDLDDTSPQPSRSVSRLFEQLDVNGDGVISKKEFLSGLAQPSSPVHSFVLSSILPSQSMSEMPQAQVQVEQPSPPPPPPPPPLSPAGRGVSPKFRTELHSAEDRKAAELFPSSLLRSQRSADDDSGFSTHYEQICQRYLPGAVTPPSLTLSKTVGSVHAAMQRSSVPRTDHSKVVEEGVPPELDATLLMDPRPKPEPEPEPDSKSESDLAPDPELKKPESHAQAESLAGHRQENGGTNSPGVRETLVDAVALMSSTETYLRKRPSASSHLQVTPRSRETQPRSPQQQEVSPLHPPETSSSTSPKGSIPSVIAGLDWSVLDAPSRAAKPTTNFSSLLRPRGAVAVWQKPSA